MHNLIYYITAGFGLITFIIVYLNLKNLLNLFNQNIQNINLTQTSLRDNLSNSLSNQILLMFLII